MTEQTAGLAERLAWGLIPAVPVPFRGTELDAAAQREYAGWMAVQPVAGVAVWAHTGRGPHLSAEQRRGVLETWREALPERMIVAGARDITMAIEARRGRADALLAFPTSADPVAHHARLSRELPVIAFWLYEAAGGVAYDDAAIDRSLAILGEALDEVGAR
jgi:4-hydroxy-tetrahydrodipicolinate synthase